MKTEHIGNNSDPIWASNVELLPSEDCLPVIGSCQVSSILKNLDSANNDHNLQNMDLIILHENDYKLPLDAPLNLHSNNYMVLKDPVHSESNNSHLKHQIDSNTSRIEKKKSEPTDLSLSVPEPSNSNASSRQSPIEKHYDKESFEDMLYFVCNLCPFLCTKETKITEHLEASHKKKTLSKLVQLKCPACVNIFYHRASLKSHLLHDHCVASVDLNLIVQAVVFYSNKENKKGDQKKTGENENKDNNGDKAQENETVKIGGAKTVNNVVKVDSSSGGLAETELEGNPQQPTEKIPLPQVDITANNSEKLITNLMKKPNPVVKYIHSQKCIYPSCKVLLTDMKKMDFHFACHSVDGFKCIECQEKFIFWKGLTSHLWRIHKIDMELFSCDKCDYKTPNLSKLNKVHKLTHGTVKAYQCNLCEKSFKNSKQLRNHKAVHKEKVQKELLTCDICSKRFSDKRRLKAHLDSVHKKLKPYLCNYCGYKGSSRASLRMHIRMHTGEKPFSCCQCSYSTSDHNSLRRHKLRHTGQKPYKCAYCSYACIQSSTYKVHLKTKHPGMEKDLMFTCFMCQFRTVNREMYASHLVTVHKQKPSVN